MTSASRVRDWGLLLICNLIWGSQFVFSKLVQREMGPLFATLLPLGLTILVLLPVSVYQSRIRIIPAQEEKQGSRTVSLIVLGVFGQAAALLLGTWGVRLTLASNAALLNLALPVTTAIMAYLLLSERMTAIRAISFVLAIAGVIECSGINWHELNFSSPQILLGNTLCFLAIVSSAFYNTYSKKILTGYSPVRLVFYTKLVAFLVLLPITIYSESQSFKELAHFSKVAWIGILFLALLRNLLALLLFLYVLKRLDATVAGMSNYLIPFFGVLTAATFLHEKLPVYMIMGGLLVLSSTLLATMSDSRTRQPAAVSDPAR